MTEGPPNEDAGREQKRKELIALAIEISGNQEGFPFPGIDPEIYLGIKAALEKFPGYSTPIDELIEKFKSEGMKVVLGTYREKGDVFVLPLHSDNLADDNLFPSDLRISNDMDEKLKKLILMKKHG